MKRFVFGNIPPLAEGGFHYPQALPSGSTEIISGSTRDEVIASLQNFRFANGIDVGDPQREVDSYLCGRWPRFCSEEDATVADETRDNKNLRQRTTNWKSNRYAQSDSSDPLVSDEIAEKRAATCETCPKNQDNRSGCPPCVVDNDRVLFMLREGRNVKNSESLGGCDVCGQDNRTAVFFPDSSLKYANAYQDQFPDFCWLKK